MAIDNQQAVQDVPYAKLRERLLADGQVLEFASEPAPARAKGAGRGAVPRVTPSPGPRLWDRPLPAPVRPGHLVTSRAQSWFQWVERDRRWPVSRGHLHLRVHLQVPRGHVTFGPMLGLSGSRCACLSFQNIFEAKRNTSEPVKRTNLSNHSGQPQQALFLMWMIKIIVKTCF